MAQRLEGSQWKRMLPGDNRDTQQVGRAKDTVRLEGKIDLDKGQLEGSIDLDKGQLEGSRGQPAEKGQLVGSFGRDKDLLHYSHNLDSADSLDSLDNQPFLSEERILREL